ncbi:MAG: hypothetical protein JWQ27_2251 [Ferruginibacter sp.]|nr:hypothetical protein [Ferruginibacter sp.]
MCRLTIRIYLNSLIDNKEAPSEPDSVCAFNYNPGAPPEPELRQVIMYFNW